MRCARQSQSLFKKAVELHRTDILLMCQNHEKLSSCKSSQMKFQMMLQNLSHNSRVHLIKRLNSNGVCSFVWFTSKKIRINCIYLRVPCRSHRGHCIGHRGPCMSHRGPCMSRRGPCMSRRGPCKSRRGPCILLRNS